MRRPRLGRSGAGAETDEAAGRPLGSDGAVVVFVRAARAVVGVVHFRACPPGGPVNVAVLVEEVFPGKAAGAIQEHVAPQFGAAGGIGRVVGARVIGVGKLFFGERSESPGAAVMKAPRGREDIVSTGGQRAAERKKKKKTVIRPLEQFASMLNTGV